VPYKGAAPGGIDLMGGPRCRMMIIGSPWGCRSPAGGKVRALGVSSPHGRSAGGRPDHPDASTSRVRARSGSEVC
jgi:tripartite-type tricarboxylate transporter receptor subunit TctC